MSSDLYRYRIQLLSNRFRHLLLCHFNSIVYFRSRSSYVCNLVKVEFGFTKVRSLGKEEHIEVIGQS